MGSARTGTTDRVSLRRNVRQGGRDVDRTRGKSVQQPAARRPSVQQPAARRPEVPLLQEYAAPPQRRLASSTASEILALQRAVGNRTVARQLSSAGYGDGLGARVHVQRQDPVTTPSAASPATAFQARYGGNFDLAAVAVKGRWDAVGGIVTRQRDAVNDFADAVQREDQPDWTEAIAIAALESALSLALGGIGGAIKARLGRTVRAAALAGMINAEVSGAAPAEIIGAAGLRANQYISAVVDEGKSHVTSFISSGVRGNLVGPPAEQFRSSNLDTLNSVAQRQGDTLIQRLARAPEAQRWVVAEGLYEAFGESLDDAYQQQIDAMTDNWFTTQTRTVGGGARQGVLRIDLTDTYANHQGQLQADGANLLGAGVNDTTRGWLQDRPLEEISIPKYVKMNGKLGYGINDCVYGIRVFGARPQSRGPTVSAARSGPAYLHDMDRTQRPQSITTNRWGGAWLAAYHLRLQDLDNDDPRLTDDAVSQGVTKVWNAIKRRSIAGLGAEFGSSSW